MVGNKYEYVGTTESDFKHKIMSGDIESSNEEETNKVIEAINSVHKLKSIRI